MAGLSSAVCLAQSGCSVVLLEQDQLTSGSSSLSVGVYTRQYTDPFEISMRMYAFEVLERLVVSASTKAPDRAEEWRAYLYYLRDFADEKGRLPRSFDGLVADVFGDVASA